jgi:acetyl-CoA/propionyl-CoA carboxylase biotin carboxyl carrier protein
MTQKQVLAARRGHAIEVRINAENPSGGKFLPSPGTITKLTTPDGFGVRFDGGYESGDTVSQYYDNLIGKLIVWGKDRESAIARTIRALEETKIEGLHTTIEADLAILRHPDFAATKHSTKWVEEKLDLSKLVSSTGETQQNNEGLVEKSTVVEVNGKRFDVKVWVPPVGGTAPAAQKTRSASRGADQSAAASGTITAPMQGTVIKVLVTEGQTVAQGDAVLVLEAMKMENQIQADKAGKVAKINCKAGDTVGSGDVLLVIE